MLGPGCAVGGLCLAFSGFGLPGFWFPVSGLCVRAQLSGFRIEVFRFQYSRFVVYGLWVMVKGAGLKPQRASPRTPLAYEVSGFGFRVLGFLGSRISGFGFRVYCLL